VGLQREHSIGQDEREMEGHRSLIRVLPFTKMKNIQNNQHKGSAPLQKLDLKTKGRGLRMQVGVLLIIDGYCPCIAWVKI